MAKEGGTGLNNVAMMTFGKIHYVEGCVVVYYDEKYHVEIKKKGVKALIFPAIINVWCNDRTIKIFFYSEPKTNKNIINL